MNLRRTNRRVDVVADLRRQVQDAKAISAVPDQDLLADPRLNPATRGEADALAAERLRTRLEMEHRREVRAAREGDRRAEEAVRAAAAVDAARAATDEAYTVLDLVRSRSRFSHLCLGASMLLSVGSAMGLEAAVSIGYPTAPTGIGYLGEVALTGMSTAAIVWAGKLARADALPRGGARAALVALIAVPLLVSAVGSTIGSGPVGAIASLGSAAFSAMAYLVATTSATAISGLVARIDRRTAGGARAEEQRPAGAVPLPRREGRSRGALAVVGEAIADEAAEYLREEVRRGDDAGGTTVLPPGDDGPTRGDGAPPEAPPAALEDAARRRTEQARKRVEDYYAAHPGMPVKRAAADLRMDPKTVRKHRPAGGAS